MSDTEGQEATPMSLIAVGLVLAVLTGLLAFASDAGDGDARWVILAVGGGIAQLFLWVGLVSKGVQIGMRAAREDERREAAAKHARQF